MGELDSFEIGYKLYVSTGDGTYVSVEDIKPVEIVDSINVDVDVDSIRDMVTSMPTGMQFKMKIRHRELRKFKKNLRTFRNSVVRRNRRIKRQREKARRALWILRNCTER